MFRRFACLYEVLGVARNADKVEVKNAFYKQAKLQHPDLSGNDSRGFNKIKEAYDVLIDDDKRYDYDLSQGYLNAFDIDEMQMKQHKFGSKYASNTLQNLDDLLQNTFQEPFSKPKQAASEDFTKNPLFRLRLKFGICLFGGFAVTFNSLIWLIEKHIYPT